MFRIEKGNAKSMLLNKMDKMCRHNIFAWHILFIIGGENGCKDVRREAVVDDEDAPFTYCNEMNGNCCRFAAPLTIQCPVPSSTWPYECSATGSAAAMELDCSLSDNEVVPFYVETGIVKRLPFHRDNCTLCFYIIPKHFQFFLLSVQV